VLVRATVDPGRGAGHRFKDRPAAADVDRVGVIVALLFFALVLLSAVLAGAAYYYARYLRPRLAATPDPATAEAAQETDSLARFVEQLEELARLRDEGILTSREFTSKKGELLERM
jgi:hypothetical protein